MNAQDADRISPASRTSVMMMSPQIRTTFLFALSLAFIACSDTAKENPNEDTSEQQQDTSVTADTQTADTNTTSNDTQDDTQTSQDTALQDTGSGDTQVPQDTQQPSDTQAMDTSGGDDLSVDKVEYAAFALIGALDRVVVRKANSTTGLCTELRLVLPAVGGTFNITTPENWSVESARIWDSLTGCLMDVSAGSTSDFSVSGTGTISWPDPGPGQFYPCMIDLDVTLDFEQSQPFAPAQDTLRTTGLTVMGC